MIFWQDAELKTYIAEALSLWNCLTQYWAQDYVFTLTPPLASDWIFTNNAGPRQQTLTDFDVYSIMLWHLMEPQLASGAWTGTNQFSLADLSQAVQRKRDEILQVTACNMEILSPNVPPNTDRIYLPDTTLDVRRVRYLAADGTTATLTKGDSLSFMRFSPGYRQVNSQPTRYDVLGSPPLALTLDFSPNQPNTLEILAMQAGNTLAPPTSSPLQIPNDWAWVVKFGALSDVLSKEPESTDRERAAYCMKRYTEGLELMTAMPWLLTANVNDGTLDTPSVIGKDRYSYEWQENPAAWPGVVIGGIDLCAVCPIPAIQTGVTLTLVGNAPQPVSDGDFVQVPRDVLDVLLDEAQHLAAFKMAGSDFASTLPLHQNFIRYAEETSLRLRRSGIFATDLRPPTSKQDLADPRSDVKGK